MPLNYLHVEILTDEEARYQKKPLYDAIVYRISKMKSAIRCIITKGCGGCNEGGDLITQSILALSMNMPVKIDIIGPAAEINSILPELEAMVTEGIILKQQKDVQCHKTKKRLLPKHIRVRDIMTSAPKTITPDTAIRDIVCILTDSPFNGLPVVDATNKPVGMVTSGDLMRKAQLPVRVGLLALSEMDGRNQVLDELAQKTAGQIMTHPVESLKENMFVHDAVNLMLKKSIKRMPVVDDSGAMVGMLSRLDIFKTISRTLPVWKKLADQKLKISNVKIVADIMLRDCQTVTPETRVEQVLKMIAADNIQRIAVVDKEDLFLGMISDRDLLYAFLDKKGKIRQFVANRVLASEKTQKGYEIKDETVAAIMQTNLLTVQEDTPVEEAIEIMTEKGLKRLPVLGPKGKFKGMVSRDALLRAGVACS